MERSRRGKKHAAQRGSLNVMSNAPYGYRYVTARDGGGQARFELISEQVDVVRDIFEWIRRERCTLGEVCCRSRVLGINRDGKPFGLVRRSGTFYSTESRVYEGTAAYGKTHMMPRTRKSRPRPPRGRPAEPRRSKSAIAVDQQDWVLMPAPPLSTSHCSPRLKSNSVKTAPAQDWDCGDRGTSFRG
jgi:site-specific DNA recombinase